MLFERLDVRSTVRNALHLFPILRSGRGGSVYLGAVTAPAIEAWFEDRLAASPGASRNRVRTEAKAQVAYLQEHLSDDTPAGFGAKLLDPSPDLCAMIAQFAQ